MKMISSSETLSMSAQSGNCPCLDFTIDASPNCPANIGQFSSSEVLPFECLTLLGDADVAVDFLGGTWPADPRVEIAEQADGQNYADYHHIDHRDVLPYDHSPGGTITMRPPA